MFSKYNWCGMTSCGFTIDFYEIGILLIDDHKELAVIRLLSHHPIIRGRLHNDLPILWAPATSFWLNHEHMLTLKGCNPGQFTYIHNHWSSKVRIASSFFFLQRNLQLCHKSLVLWTEQQCTELVQLFTCITFKELIFVNSVGYSNQIVLVGSFVKIWQAFFLFPFKDLTYICSVNVRIRSRVSWGQFCVPIVPVQRSCWY